MSILLWPNLEKHNIKETLDKVVQYLYNNSKNDIDKPIMLKQHAKFFYYDNIGIDFESNEVIPIAISFGGDGTFLGMCRELLKNKYFHTRVCGINLGNLGFLTNIGTNNLANRLNDLVNKHYKSIKRNVLIGNIDDVNQIAINDISVTKGSMISRMLNLSLYIDNKYFMNYRADGLIISTATGSTGYSLSAGGSIVHPSVEALLITPICAHSISMKPLIISFRSSITIKIDDSKEALATFDGQKSYKLNNKQEIHIKSAPYKLNTIQFQDLDYYDIIKEKLIK